MELNYSKKCQYEAKENLWKWLSIAKVASLCFHLEVYVPNVSTVTSILNTKAAQPGSFS